MALEEKLKEAVRRLHIQDVTLKSIVAHLADGFVPGIDADDAFSVQSMKPVCRSIRMLETDEPPARRRHIFQMFAGLRLFQEREEGYEGLTQDELDALLTVSIECEFLVQYDEPAGAGEYLDDEAIALYGRDNVPFSMWPYWREVVQSACSRMGLPRIILPTHRLNRPIVASGGAQVPSKS